MIFVHIYILTYVLNSNERVHSTHSTPPPLACMFAYGQTSSGKSFTILGDEGGRRGTSLLLCWGSFSCAEDSLFLRSLLALLELAARSSCVCCSHFLRLQIDIDSLMKPRSQTHFANPRTCLHSLPQEGIDQE
jgi:hypothetical protein